MDRNLVNEHDILVGNDAGADERKAHHLAVVFRTVCQITVRPPAQLRLSRKASTGISRVLAVVFRPLRSGLRTVLCAQLPSGRHQSPNYVNHSQAGNVVMLGVGGIFAVVLSNSYGKLPLLFWMLVASVVLAILCAAA